MATKSRERSAAVNKVCMCPHCADSKFPCVNMEQTMKRAGEKETDANRDEDTT